MISSSIKEETYFNWLPTEIRTEVIRYSNSSKYPLLKFLINHLPRGLDSTVNDLFRKYSSDIQIVIVKWDEWNFYPIIDLSPANSDKFIPEDLVRDLIQIIIDRWPLPDNLSKLRLFNEKLKYYHTRYEVITNGLTYKLT